MIKNCGPAETIFGQRSGPALAGPPTTALFPHMQTVGCLKRRLNYKEYTLRDFTGKRDIFVFRLKYGTLLIDVISPYLEQINHY